MAVDGRAGGCAVIFPFSEVFRVGAPTPPPPDEVERLRAELAAAEQAIHDARARWHVEHAETVRLTATLAAVTAHRDRLRDAGGAPTTVVEELGEAGWRRRALLAEATCRRHDQRAATERDRDAEHQAVAGYYRDAARWNL
jgi:hypothetical protein